MDAMDSWHPRGVGVRYCLDPAFRWASAGPLAGLCGGRASSFGGACDGQQALGRFFIRHYPPCVAMVLAVLAPHPFLALAPPRPPHSLHAPHHPPPLSAVVPP